MMKRIFAIGSALACFWLGRPAFAATTVPVDANCAHDDTAAIQAAVNTGQRIEIPAGCYVVSSDITITTNNQIIEGDGPGSKNQSSGTLIYVSSNAGFTHGVFVLAPSGTDGMSMEGPQVQNLGITFLQPDTSTRASLTYYAPAIYAQGAIRFRLYNDRITQCIVCVDMRGNAGGSFLENLELSGYGTLTVGTQAAAGGIILMDGSLDTVRLAHIHIWPFDLTANQQRIFTNPGTIGLSAGRVDGLEVTEWLSLSGTGMNLYYGTYSGNVGVTQAMISSSGFDAFNGISASGYSSGTGLGPNVAISSSYFNVTNAGYSAINASAGMFTLSAVSIGQSSSTTTPIINLNDATGTTSLIWDGGPATTNSSDVTLINASGDAGVTVQVQNIRIQKTANQNYNQPIFNIGSGPRVIFQNNYVTDKGSGTGIAFDIAGDGFNIVQNNVYPGWTSTFPSGSTMGIYSPNL